MPELSELSDHISAVADDMLADSVSSDTNMSPYEQQKLSGERRDDGSLNLKTLKPIHFKVIELHLAHKKNSYIAEKFGKTQATISRWLSDPLVKAEIQKAIKQERSRLATLTGKAIDAVNEALDKKETGVKLRGVDRFIKLSQHLDGDKEDELTAEDIVKQIMSLNINVQVNNS